MDGDVVKLRVLAETLGIVLRNFDVSHRVTALSVFRANRKQAYVLLVTKSLDRLDAGGANGRCGAAG
jgi:hypothetical protein